MLRIVSSALEDATAPALEPGARGRAAGAGRRGAGARGAAPGRSCATRWPRWQRALDGPRLAAAVAGGHADRATAGTRWPRWTMLLARLARCARASPRCRSTRPCRRRSPSRSPSGAVHRVASLRRHDRSRRALRPARRAAARVVAARAGHLVRRVGARAWPTCAPGWTHSTRAGCPTRATTSAMRPPSPPCAARSASSSCRR